MGIANFSTEKIRLRLAYSMKIIYISRAKLKQKMNQKLSLKTFLFEIYKNNLDFLILALGNY